jgi:hypothetical protein
MRLFSGARVPVTAKLSRKFYDRLGDDIAAELVDWFNAVDLTYQTQLRDMNDQNWERFKSHLDSGLAVLRAELQGEFRAGFAELQGEIRSGLAELRTEFSTERNKLLKWMLICFSSFFVGLAGLVVGLATFLNSN